MVVSVSADAKYMTNKILPLIYFLKTASAARSIICLRPACARSAALRWAQAGPALSKTGCCWAEQVLGRAEENMLLMTTRDTLLQTRVLQYEYSRYQYRTAVRQVRVQVPSYSCATIGL